MRVTIISIVLVCLATWTMHQDLRHTPACRVTFEALAVGLKRHVATQAAAGQS
jgi:hypothetical protein